LTLKEIETIEGVSDRSLYSVSWSTSGVIAVACGNNSIELLNGGADGAIDRAVTRLCSLSDAHERDVNCVAWNTSDASLLASCGQSTRFCKSLLDSNTHTLFRR
jgi:WD40 repeat protein